MSQQVASTAAPRSQSKKGSARRHNYFGRRGSPTPQDNRRESRISSQKQAAPIIDDGGFQFRVKPSKKKGVADEHKSVSGDIDLAGLANFPEAEDAGLESDSQVAAADQPQLRRSTRKRKQRFPGLGETSSQSQQQQQQQADRQSLERRRRAALNQAAIAFQYPNMPFDAQQALQGSKLSQAAVDEEHFLHYAQLLFQNELQRLHTHSQTFRQSQQLQQLLDGSGSRQATKRSKAATAQPSSEELLESADVEEVLQPLDETFDFLEKQLKRACGRFLDAYQTQFVLPAVKDARQRSRQAGKHLQPNPKNLQLQEQSRIWDGLLENMNAEIELLEQLKAEVDGSQQAAEAIAAEARGLQPAVAAEGNSQKQQQQQQQLALLTQLGQSSQPSINPGLEKLVMDLIQRPVVLPAGDPAIAQQNKAAELSAALPEAFNYISLRTDGIQSSLNRLQQVTAQADEEQAARAAQASAKSLSSYDYPGKSPKLIKDLLGK